MLLYYTNHAMFMKVVPKEAKLVGLSIRILRLAFGSSLSLGINAFALLLASHHLLPCIGCGSRAPTEMRICQIPLVALALVQYVLL